MRVGKPAGVADYRLWKPIAGCSVWPFSRACGRAALVLIACDHAASSSRGSVVRRPAHTATCNLAGSRYCATLSRRSIVAQWYCVEPAADGELRVRTSGRNAGGHCLIGLAGISAPAPGRISGCESCLCAGGRRACPRGVDVARFAPTRAPLQIAPWARCQSRDSGFVPSVKRVRGFAVALHRRAASPSPARSGTGMPSFNVPAYLLPFRALAERHPRSYLKTLLPHYTSLLPRSVM